MKKYNLLFLLIFFMFLSIKICESNQVIIICSGTGNIKIKSSTSYDNLLLDNELIQKTIEIPGMNHDLPPTKINWEGKDIKIEIFFKSRVATFKSPKGSLHLFLDDVYEIGVPNNKRINTNNDPNNNILILQNNENNCFIQSLK